MKKEFCVVMTNAVSADEAEKMADVLLDEKLASCIQILPVSNVYKMNGKKNKSQEVLLMIKTRTDLFSELEAFIKSNCSYDIPQIIALPITYGSYEYLSWIDAETK
jgi:periplasmic divalent cation tolerance protein